MAFDERLADRIRERLDGNPAISEKRMFGGIAFLHAGNLCCGVIGDQLVARVGREDYESALAETHVRKMDFTGKPLTGFVYVAPEAVLEDAGLERWLERCLDVVMLMPPK